MALTSILGHDGMDCCDMAPNANIVRLNFELWTSKPFNCICIVVAAAHVLSNILYEYDYDIIPDDDEDEDDYPHPHLHHHE